MTCRAYRSGDQMRCPCGLAWDVDDPDPPECPRTRAANNGHMVDLRVAPDRRARTPGTVKLEMPVDLPLEIAQGMARAAGAAAGYQFGTAEGVAAMVAAYRVLLDLVG